MSGRPTPNQRCAVEVVLDSSLDLQRLPRAESITRIPLSHTTYQYHSKRINKTPNTGIIPVKVAHSLSVVLAFFVFLELHLPTLIEHAHRLVDDRPRSSLN